MPRKKSQQKQFVPRSPEQARDWLKANGITVSAFAHQIEVNPTVVFDLLRGRSQGNYGDSHKAAIALGLKAPPNSATDFQSSKRSGG
ncbi:MAG TPA: DNA-binding protein [Stenotrophomonas sp.]|nr:DNA-binding protein [Stenotrophomonas sp.]